MDNIKFISFFVFVFILSNTVSGQDNWNIPENKKNINSQIIFDYKAAKEGKPLYYKHCSSCHGDLGKGNDKKIVPAPGDLSLDIVSKNTDGELYYKITEGMGLMPSFKKVISDYERWLTMAYTRSFHKNYKQNINVTEIHKYEGDTIIADIKALMDSKRIKIHLTGKVNGETFPIVGAEIGAFIERMFGIMRLGENVETDDYGYAFINFSETISGNENGDLDLKFKLLDENIFGKVEFTETLRAGVPYNDIDILEGKHMWSTNKSPAWLSWSFYLVIIAIWGYIIHIQLNIRKIKKIGKQNN